MASVAGTTCVAEAEEEAAMQQEPSGGGGDTWAHFMSSERAGISFVSDQDARFLETFSSFSLYSCSGWRWIDCQR